MRERGAFGFLGVMLVVTIMFFALQADQTELPVSGINKSGVPVIMINGRSFDPSFMDQGDEGRMIIVVDQDDLFIGENTVEFRWGNNAPSSTMTAELPSGRQQH